jgi:hypothetical protein
MPKGWLDAILPPIPKWLIDGMFNQGGDPNNPMAKPWDLPTC